ncbi:MAG: hypothetical protein QXG78_00710, partial [Candidatus Methanomethyliaceae archaeon]
ILIFFILQQFFGVVVPKYNELLRLSEDKNVAENKLKKIEIFKSAIEKIANDPMALKIYETKKQGILDLYLPTDFQDYELILIINTIFRSSGLGEPNIYQFSDDKISLPNIPSAQLTKKVFEVSFKASLSDLLNLLKNFENYSRFFEIENLDIKKEDNLLGIKMKVAYFYLSQIKPKALEEK